MTRLNLGFSFMVFMCLLLSFSTLKGQESGIIFFEGSFEEALIAAKQEDKMVFVDAYTTWCGPCKMMKKNVFPNEDVGNYYNKHFINMAIDMETQSGRSFNSSYTVTGYPTLLYINPDGTLIKKSVGAKNVERFIALGESAIKADDRSLIYADMYESGRRDFDFMVKYIKSLQKVEKPTSKISYEYLKGGYNLTDAQKAVIMFEAASSSDSKMFENMTTPRFKKHLLDQYGDLVYKEKIYALCWATVQKGVEYNVPELIDEGKKHYKSEVKNNYKVFEMEADLAEARSNSDASKYLKVARKRIKTIEDPDQKNDFLLNMVSMFPANDNILDFAESASGDVLKEHDSIETNFAFAKILIAKNRFKKSLEYLNRALELANEEKEFVRARDIHLLRKEIRSKI